MKALILTVTLAACGSTPGLHFDGFGQGEQARMQQAFATVTATLDAVSTDDFSGALAGYSLTVRRQVGIFDCGGRQTYGCTQYYGDRAIQIDLDTYGSIDGGGEYLPLAAIAHELTHAFLCTKGNCDAAHSDPRYWAKDGVVWRATAALENTSVQATENTR